MKKIQAEIDKVVGSDRAPTWEDEMNLPYLRASIKGPSLVTLPNLRTSPLATRQ
jgi:hypothetical protein